MMELIASYNEQVGAFILDNTLQNAKYTSHQIKKEIYMSLLKISSLQFVMRWVIQNFVWLLMKLEMNSDERKWFLLLGLLI